MQIRLGVSWIQSRSFAFWRIAGMYDERDAQGPQHEARDPPIINGARHQAYADADIPKMLHRFHVISIIVTITNLKHSSDRPYWNERGTIIIRTLNTGLRAVYMSYVGAGPGQVQKELMPFIVHMACTRPC